MSFLINEKGAIPTEIGTSLAWQVYLQKNILTGEIPAEVDDMPEMGDTRMLFKIHNNTGMTGEAPSALCAFGAQFFYRDTSVTCPS